jgi:hypothetical protein
MRNHGVIAVVTVTTLSDEGERVTKQRKYQAKHDRVRLTSRPAGWDHDTTVQVTVSTSASGRTTLRFHQEWPAGPEERARQRARWKDVLAAVERALAAPNE